mmetsp:Transcript_19571/g.65741  ORF Transcript_19571/g.65741 Transcript_19571/m.65741 type:complete len:304 (+) Transcript_19571:50-961(+)
MVAMAGPSTRDLTVASEDCTSQVGQGGPSPGPWGGRGAAPPEADSGNDAAWTDHELNMRASSRSCMPCTMSAKGDVAHASSTPLPPCRAHTSSTVGASACCMRCASRGPTTPRRTAAEKRDRRVMNTYMRSAVAASTPRLAQSAPNTQAWWLGRFSARTRAFTRARPSPEKHLEAVTRRAAPCMRLAREATSLSTHASQSSSARAKPSGDGSALAARTNGKNWLAAFSNKSTTTTSKGRRSPSLSPSRATMPSCHAASRPREWGRPPLGSAESTSCQHDQSSAVAAMSARAASALRLFGTVAA